MFCLIWELLACSSYLPLFALGGVISVADTKVRAGSSDCSGRRCQQNFHFLASPRTKARNLQRKKKTDAVVGKKASRFSRKMNRVKNELPGLQSMLLGSVIVASRLTPPRAPDQETVASDAASPEPAEDVDMAPSGPDKPSGPDMGLRLSDEADDSERQNDSDVDSVWGSIVYKHTGEVSDSDDEYVAPNDRIVVVYNHSRHPA